ncbi:protein kinase activator [Schizosaccharomyces cryophilus OY26]|uniref:5'-AMP-activated protein kinase subunit gamma n=1 Tax=Schizosaccharomyces cryophilus (strain OY26 / ATCC MYA-4695 / CBS 11777 / NBRC 106824 / NRRL Y48691) TaxID=653667 RepID=S9VUT9_SCHCR|nr:protein kinase activator [Schizosaccharomyces cryophilus OY26]EPY51563.1 protein kinase activator [Schizosaccharomyces cryophilus OY26]
MTDIHETQKGALKEIQAFIRSRTSYDVLPTSFRLIVFDVTLFVKTSLSLLALNNIVSAPLWDSEANRFAGLLTMADFVNVIKYYYQSSSVPEALAEIDKFRLLGLREVERKIGAIPPETLYVHPMHSLMEACLAMSKSRARRVPLIDVDGETGSEMIVSVLTQYRILKFISMNCKETSMLRVPLNELRIGTWSNLATSTMDTKVYAVIKTLAEQAISAVPIVNDEGILINVYESVDVMHLIQDGDYNNLDLTVGEALLRRPSNFAGVHTCRDTDHLDGIFDAIKHSRVHRLFVVSEDFHLKGILSLSDILNYIVNDQL